MLFSPITARSLRIRTLYAALYALLGLGGITMIVPFFIMISGSLEPQSTRGEITLFPTYLVSDEALWQRYLETKYHGQTDYLRQAWSDPDVSFITSSCDGAHDTTSASAGWQTFLSEVNPAPHLFTLGFLRMNNRMPSYSGREFRAWLIEKYGDLARINSAFSTQFKDIPSIRPPLIGFIGSTVPDVPMTHDWFAFSAAQPASHKFAWDVGGYYRAVFLPRTLGPDIALYNEENGTRYATYAEIPFPALAPTIGRDSWFNYVSRLVRTDFIELTPAGEAARQALAIDKQEFLRTRAKPEDIRVVSMDTLFADWAVKNGIENPAIPQRSLDLAAFAQEKNFWRWKFVTLNYTHVFDQLALHGRAAMNTLILVSLSILGALIINPMAAYALSRFKLRSTYSILLFCLVTIAFPAEVTMIPVFLQLKEFHLLNTFAALILPTVANGFSIFLLKGFFDSLPRELYEAAEIDGASEWMVFWQFTMNLSKPILAVIALDAFVGAYGAFFYALVIAPDPAMWTLMVHIFQMRQGADAPVVYASLILTAIPTLLIFVFCQNIILRGIVVPSDK